MYSKNYGFTSDPGENCQSYRLENVVHIFGEPNTSMTLAQYSFE